MATAKIPELTDVEFRKLLGKALIRVSLGRENLSFWYSIPIQS
jgi:hypothetical protein